MCGKCSTYTYMYIFIEVSNYDPLHNLYCRHLSYTKVYICNAFVLMGRDGLIHNKVSIYLSIK